MAKDKPEPDVVRVGGKKYDLAKEKKWVRDYVAELRDKAEEAEGLLAEENTVTDQREDIVGLWAGISASRYTRGDLAGSIRAYGAARLVQAATRIGNGRAGQ